MIGCLRTCIRKQPIIALYFESENVLLFYNLEARSSTGSGGVEQIAFLCFDFLGQRCLLSATTLTRMKLFFCDMPIIALYFEFETVLKFYNLEARSLYSFLAGSPLLDRSRTVFKPKHDRISGIRHSREASIHHSLWLRTVTKGAITIE